MRNKDFCIIMICNINEFEAQTLSTEGFLSTVLYSIQWKKSFTFLLTHQQAKGQTVEYRLRRNCRENEEFEPISQLGRYIDFQDREI